MSPNRSLSVLLVTILAVAALYLPQVASANSSTPASGTWADCNFTIDVHPVGNATLTTVLIIQTFTGTLNGRFVGTEWDLAHPGGAVEIVGRGLFTGRVAGRLGTVEMNYTGIAHVTNPVFQVGWSITKGSGGLADVQGQGTFQGTSIPPTPTCAIGYGGTYAGHIRLGASSPS